MATQYQTAFSAPVWALTPTVQTPVSYASRVGLGIAGTVNGKSLKDHLALTVSTRALKLPTPANANQKHYDAFRKQVERNAEWKNLSVAEVKQDEAKTIAKADVDDAPEPLELTAPDIQPVVIEDTLPDEPEIDMATPQGDALEAEEMLLQQLMTRAQQRTLIALDVMTQYLDDVLQAQSQGGLNSKAAIKDFLDYAVAQEAMQFMASDANPAEMVNPLALQALGQRIETLALPFSVGHAEAKPAAFVQNQHDMTAPQTVAQSQSLSAQLKNDLAIIAVSTDFDPLVVQQAALQLQALPELNKGLNVAQDAAVAPIAPVSATPAPSIGPNENAVVSLIAKAKEQKAEQNREILQKEFDGQTDTRQLNAAYFYNGQRVNYGETLQGTTIKVAAETPSGADNSLLSRKTIKPHALVRSIAEQRIQAFAGTVSDHTASTPGLIVTVINSDGATVKDNLLQKKIEFNLNAYKIGNVDNNLKDHTAHTIYKNPDLRQMGLSVSF